MRRYIAPTFGLARSRVVRVTVMCCTAYLRTREVDAMIPCQFRTWNGWTLASSPSCFLQASIICREVGRNM